MLSSSSSCLWSASQRPTMNRRGRQEVRLRQETQLALYRSSCRSLYTVTVQILLLVVTGSVVASCPGYVLPNNNNTALRAPTTHTRLVHDVNTTHNMIQPQHMASFR